MFVQVSQQLDLKMLQVVVKRELTIVVFEPDLQKEQTALLLSVGLLLVGLAAVLLIVLQLCSSLEIKRYCLLFVHLY